MKPISVQLYSLREESAKDFESVLKTLADVGYRGVEPFALYGMEPGELKTVVEDLGMAISSSHHPWANRTEINEVIDTVSAMGLKHAAGGFGPADFRDMDTLQQTVDTINELTEQLKPAGIELFLHNHWFEFVEVDGHVPYHFIQEHCPDVLFEVDTYWAANFGERSPAEEVARIRHRMPFMHIKDGPLRRDEAHVAVGDGAMDIRATIEAADDNVLQWVIVELDACETDMMTAVTESYNYLTTQQLAAGSK